MSDRAERDTVSDHGRRPGSRDGDIQAVARCAQLLRLVARNSSVRASDVEAGLGLQRSTAHRYLASMANSGLIERGENGAFGPGPLAVHLGAVAMRAARVIDVATPSMEDLAADAHETVVLSLWGGSGAVVTRVSEDASRLVNTSVREGSELPLHAAQSQVFLAHLPDREQVDRLVATQSEHIRHELKASMERVLRTGFGDQAMVVQGIRTVAAPVFDSRGVVCASVALVGTSDSLASGPDSHLWRALDTTAQRISARLGHVRAAPSISPD
ncbi:IclR family transcriptional regulator [Streptomyces acidicola]|uniref:IclR family transcriptional regulator n=1 Tax=Streptomyces acidicola TaxID=2596892 RepID=UPI00343D8426